MGFFSRLFGTGNQDDFLASLKPAERIEVSNLNPLIYHVIIMEKRGENAPKLMMVDSQTTPELLRKLTVAELERLKESVEFAKKADQAGGSSATEYYRKAAETNPYNSIAVMSYGVSLAEAGNLREGIKWVEKARAVDPSNERIRRNLNAMRASL